MPIFGVIASSKNTGSPSLIFNMETNADFGGGFINATGQVAVSWGREYSGYGYIPASALMSNTGAVLWQRKVRQISSAANTYVGATTLSSSGQVSQIGSDSSGFATINSIDSSGNLAFQKRQNMNGGSSVGWYNGDVDSSGSIYVTGAGPAAYNYFPVAKFDTSGNVSWTQRWTDNSSAGSHNGTSLCLGPSGTLYVGGKRFTSSYQTPIIRLNTSNGSVIGSGALIDQSSDKPMTWDPVNSKLYALQNKASYFVLIQFAENLQSQAQTSNSIGSVGARDVKCDSQGNVYVFCSSYSDNANMEVSVFKYNSNLVLQWIRGFKNNATSEVFAGDGAFSAGIHGNNYFFSYKLLPDSSGSTTSTAYMVFPTDGSKTGTYSWAVNNALYGSFTYSNLDSSAFGNNQSVGISNGISMSTAALTLSNLNIDQPEITNTTFTAGVTTV